MNLWLVGWAPNHICGPCRDISLDGSIGLQISGNSNQSTLLLTNPEQDVEVMPLLPEASFYESFLYLAYRFEVITENPSQNIQEAFPLFSVYVDEKPPSPERLLSRDNEVQNPFDAEDWMFEQLNSLRIQKGLQPLLDFKLFVPLARSHSKAWMAAEGLLLIGSLV